MSLYSEYLDAKSNLLNNDSTNSRNEKRFTLAYEKGNWWAVRDYDITLWKEEVVYLLNQLHEENEQLKSKLFDCQLELEHSKESVDDAYWELTEIKKENEQLKQQLADIDRLIYDLGHDEMRRQYEEIFKGDVE